MTTTIPTQADILAALSRMDTLATAKLISRAWEQTLAQATDAEHDALGYVKQGDQMVDTFDALDTAVAALRDLREDERQSLPDPSVEWAADYRAGAL